MTLTLFSPRVIHSKSLILLSISGISHAAQSPPLCGLILHNRDVTASLRANERPFLARPGGGPTGPSLVQWIAHGQPSRGVAATSPVPVPSTVRPSVLRPCAASNLGRTNDRKQRGRRRRVDRQRRNTRARAQKGLAGRARRGRVINHADLTLFRTTGQ